MSLDSLSGKLRLVRQYSPENVLISLEEVTPTFCKPLRMIINPQRLVGTECLFQLFIELSIRPYQPVKLTSELEQKIQGDFPQHSYKPNDISPFYIVPPIIEVHEGDHCIIDGLHRMYIAKLHGGRPGLFAPERDSGSKNGGKSRSWFWSSPPAAHAGRWAGTSDQSAA